MVKYVCLKIWAFVLGLVAVSVPKEESYASSNDDQNVIENRLSINDTKLFIEPYLNNSTSFIVAGHRSHRSHSSHRSHYSSRGSYGGYYRSSPRYIPSSPSIAPSKAVSNKIKSSSGNIGNISLENDLVKEIQIKLKELEFFEGIPDGIYGKKTKNAIILYQVEKGLTPDGLATQELLTHINNNSNK